MVMYQVRPYSGKMDPSEQKWPQRGQVGVKNAEIRREMGEITVWSLKMKIRNCARFCCFFKIKLINLFIKA